MMPREFIPPAAQSPLTTTILIVEDDADIGHFLQQLVEEETPYHTRIIDNGQKALELAPEVRPCLLLLDYRLPGMNGLELYDRLQEIEVIRGIPAIMMSASLREKVLAQRGISQLRKPMGSGRVIRRITHARASYNGKR